MGCPDQQGTKGPMDGRNVAVETLNICFLGGAGSGQHSVPFAFILPLIYSVAQPSILIFAPPAVEVVANPRRGPIKIQNEPKWCRYA